jgi:hypothetical protein
MTLDQILSRLDHVLGNGDGWIAKCPAHQDRNPSPCHQRAHSKNFANQCQRTDSPAKNNSLCHPVGRPTVGVSFSAGETRGGSCPGK